MLTTIQLRDKQSQLCGEVKTKAQNAITGNYGISSKLSVDEIKELIKMLLTKSNFTFGDPGKVHLLS